jgi:hypothetical protein
LELLIPIVVVAAIVVALLIAQTKKGKLATNVYQRQSELFSAAELRFLAALDQSLTPGQRVFGKVRIMDLVAVKSGLNPKARQAAVNRVSQKHVDFLICAGNTVTPVCAIELNDSSHGSVKAKRRDELLAAVCGQVGLPLLVVKAAGTYSPESIRQQIAGAMQTNGSGEQSVA